MKRDTPNTLEEALTERLLSLPFDACLNVVAMLLEQLGYEEVQLAGRRDFKGRNGRDGTRGFDLMAVKDHRRMVVQVKQFDRERSLFSRSVDELRGVALREGVGEALLITLGSFSPSIDRKSLLSAPFVPVKTWDGYELVSLLTQHRIGMIKGNYAIDTAFFSRLERNALGNRPSDNQGGTTLLVEVSLQRVSPKRKAALARS